MIKDKAPMDIVVKALAILMYVAQQRRVYFPIDVFNWYNKN